MARSLGEHLGMDVYYEPVADNEYLEDFYRDTARHSFAMQVYLLNRRVAHEDRPGLDPTKSRGSSTESGNDRRSRRS